MKRVLIILGPTATGKTDLALNLAKKFNGELVACDSRQVYQGLDIGTGKMPGNATSDVKKSDGWWEIGGVKIWIYDLVDLKDSYSAFDYAKDATKVIADIEKRGKLPIIVGGTGLYLKALLDGLAQSSGADSKLRLELEKLSLGELQEKVRSHSPARWERLNHSDQNNPRRLVRLLEQIQMYPYTSKLSIPNIQLSNSDVLKIGLTAPRPYLNSKINSRVFAWFALGIVQEVESLIERGVPKERFKELGLEYRLIVDFLGGKISSQEELIQLIQTKIRQYAKRQMTWFKRDKEIKWFDVSEPNLSHRVVTEVGNWYNSDKI